MKKETFMAAAMLIIMSLSCSSPKKESPKSTEPVQSAEPAPAATEAQPKQEAASTVTLGEKLYKDKGCLVCHQMDSKLVGPAIKDIAAAYAGNKEGLVAFLKGDGKPIVDPSQYSVMQPQISITKDLPADQLNEIVDYILSAK